MSYDEAYKKAEEIVRGLENAQALSMEEYRRQSVEAERLLAFCREQLTKTPDSPNLTPDSPNPLREGANRGNENLPNSVSASKGGANKTRYN